MKTNISTIAYLVGVGVALLLSIAAIVNIDFVQTNMMWFMVALAIAGLGIGYYNISSNETMSVLVMALFLGVASGFFTLMLGGEGSMGTVAIFLDTLLKNFASLSIAVGVIPLGRKVAEVMSK